LPSSGNMVIGAGGGSSGQRFGFSSPIVSVEI